MQNMSKYLLTVLTAVFLISVITIVAYRHQFGSTYPNSIVLTNAINTESVTTQSIVNGKLDINKASADELAMLPGIGKVLAERIVEYREKNGNFRTVRQLLEIKGIKESKLSQFINYIHVGGLS